MKNGPQTPSNAIGLDVRDGSILLKKSKIQRLRKFGEGRFFVVSAAASLRRTATRAYGRFCVNRCGPSHRRAWNASAALKNFVRQPKRTFSTVSVKNGRDGAYLIAIARAKFVVYLGR